MDKVYPIEKQGKKKKKKRGLPPAQRNKIYREVIERDQVCMNPFCSDGFPLDIPHHIKKKSQGGLDIAENLITLCCACHRKIHHTAELNVTGIFPDLVWYQNKF